MSASRTNEPATPAHTPLPPRPVIYEINTWVWLNALSRRYQKPITLDAVPAADWDALAALGLDAVWLMGVWQRSPTGLALAMNDEGLVASFSAALPDMGVTDLAGSPYSVRGYEVDNQLGGRDGLAVARQELAARGLGLVLDFVPNHVAPDHPWVREHPDYFIRGDAADLARAPGEFFQADGAIIARGRDPYFPPWPDVAQLNAFSPGLRAVTEATLLDIAGQCDGVRCDMAMLMTDDIFARTWGERAGPPLPDLYWPSLIDSVRLAHPEFTFIAEVYWDMEWAMQQEGFDYCYDKRLYDRLRDEGAEAVRTHLMADPAYQDRLVRFIENHDEERALVAFGPGRMRAAAVAACTLPGAKLFHEGQLDGRRVKLPVFLGRRPAEPPDLLLQTFYRQLLAALRMRALRDGRWRLAYVAGDPKQATHEQIVAWTWQDSAERVLVIVNLSDRAAQGRVQLVWPELAGQSWVFADVLSGERYERSGDEILNTGLFVDLRPWGYHFLVVE